MKNNEYKSLLKKVISNKEDYFGELATLLYPKVTEIVKTYLRSNNNIDDVVQESMLAIYNNVEKLKTFRYFNAWVYKITLNKCNDCFRKSCTNDNEFHDEKIYMKQTSPNQLVIKGEQSKVINDIVDSLPQITKITVILFYFEEFKIREIADILETNENAIKNRLSYGRKILKEQFTNYEKATNTKFYSLGALPLIIQSYVSYQTNNTHIKPLNIKKPANMAINIGLCTVAIVTSFAGYNLLNNLRLNNNVDAQVINNVKEDNIINEKDYVDKRVPIQSASHNPQLSVLEQLISKEGAVDLLNQNLDLSTYKARYNITDYKIIMIEKKEITIYYKTRWAKTIFFLEENNQLKYSILETNNKLSDEDIYNSFN